MRIASLLPSATEIVCGLGLSDQIVGISHECDYPAVIVGRPILTEPKIDPRGSSIEIDAAVRRLVRDGLSVYRIKEDALRAARPDVIVTQEQCDVCAVSFSEVQAAARAWLDAGVEIVSLNPNRLDDIFADIRRVAAAVGAVAASEQLITQAQARLKSMRERARQIHSRPRVVCIEWIEPLMAAGNWVPELVEIGGGAYDWCLAGEHTRGMTWDDLAAYAPDVVIVMPCGFTLDQTRPELPRLTTHPLWRDLPAVRNRRVYSVDGNAYLNRPGPRIVESAELLAGLIQPGFFATRIPAGSWEEIGDSSAGPD